MKKQFQNKKVNKDDHKKIGNIVSGVKKVGGAVLGGVVLVVGTICRINIHNNKTK